MSTRSVYSVIVGNIGTVETGDLTACIATYGEYVHQSEAHYGRAEDEPVTLFKDGEPFREYTPSQSG